MTMAIDYVKGPMLRMRSAALRGLIEYYSLRVPLLSLLVAPRLPAGEPYRYDPQWDRESISVIDPDSKRARAVHVMHQLDHAEMALYRYWSQLDLTAHLTTAPVHAESYGPEDFKRDVIAPCAPVGAGEGTGADTVLHSVDFYRAFMEWGWDLEARTEGGFGFGTDKFPGVKLIGAPLLDWGTAIAFNLRRVHPQLYVSSEARTAVGPGLDFDADAHCSYTSGITGFSNA